MGMQSEAFFLDQAKAPLAKRAFELEAPAHALVAHLTPRAASRHHLHVEPHEWLDVAAERAVASDHEHVPVLRDDARHHLLDAGVERPRVDVDLPQELDLALHGHVGGSLRLARRTGSVLPR